MAQQLGGGYHYDRAPDLKRVVRGTVKAEGVSFAESGQAVNGLGRVEYQRYAVGPLQCVAFHQFTGDVRSADNTTTLRGDTTIMAFYCAAPGETLGAAELPAIFNGVRIKG